MVSAHSPDAKLRKRIADTVEYITSNNSFHMVIIFKQEREIKCIQIGIHCSRSGTAVADLHGTSLHLRDNIGFGAKLAIGINGNLKHVITGSLKVFFEL